VGKDPKSAAQMFFRACHAHVAVACWVLSDLVTHETIQGFSSKQADEWARNACDLGLVEACGRARSGR